MNILYIFPGPVPPEGNPAKDKFFFLSRRSSGAVLLPVWNKTKNYAHLRQAGNYRYYFTYSFHLPGPVKFVWELLFFISYGVFLHYGRKRFDIIVPYGTNRTGVAAYVLKLLTGAKLILEIPGTPAKAFFYLDREATLKDRIKHRVSRDLLIFLHNHADHIKLISPGQLDGIPHLKTTVPHSVVHSFVPIHYIKPCSIDDKYILLVGHPWFLKGVDIVIKAFLKIRDEFPDHRLKIVGHCPNRAPFEELAGGDERIEFHAAVFHDKVIDIISRCSVYVAASRTEAFPRVLYEAMAAQKPFISSDVDGVPYYVRDGETGLLFRSEDADDLAHKLRQVLSNPELAKKIALGGHSFCQEHLSEDLYVEKFLTMLEKTKNSSAPKA